MVRILIKRHGKKSKAILNKVLEEILFCEDFDCNLEEILNNGNVAEYDALFMMLFIRAIENYQFIINRNPMKNI